MKSTSLKEEIWLRMRKSFPHNNTNTVTFVRNEILKLIEKRIDEFLAKKPKYDPCCPEDAYYYAYWDGQEFAYETIKEMLKE